MTMTARLCSYANGCKHVIHCRGCGQTWTEDANLEDSGCGCTCTDASAPDYEDWVIHPERCAVIDISSLGIQFRGAPVTLVSEGVGAILRLVGNVALGLDLILSAAAEVGEPGESGCIFQSCIFGEIVWLERFDCVYENGQHEGGRWSVFLPRER